MAQVRRLNELLVLYSARCNKYPCHEQAISSIFPGVGMGGTNRVWFDDVWCGNVGAGFSAAAIPMKPRQFWLIADAELIVYGATEPDANVTIGGRPMR